MESSASVRVIRAPTSEVGRVRVVIAPDKFRGSLTAIEAAAAMACGVRAAVPEADIAEVPMADGGEGTTQALLVAAGGALHDLVVSGPMGAPTTAQFALLNDRETAILEMASASGLKLLTSEQRDPFRTSTRGTGELLLAALDAGAHRIVMGIGGSATNDGGAGFAQALGWKLLNAGKQDIPPGNAGLEELDRIERSGVDSRIEGARIEVACDVDNPLTGPRGASAVFGPQKFPTGTPARPEQIERLDRNLARLAQVVRRDLEVDIENVPGAGAAGGLGGGLLAFAGARLRSGVELVIDAVKLEDRLRGAQLCLTGEGAVDASTAAGKTVAGVARLARRLGVPTIALAGAIQEGAASILEEGVVAYFSLCDRPLTFQEATNQAAQLLARAAEQAVRAFQAGRNWP